MIKKTQANDVPLGTQKGLHHFCLGMLLTFLFSSFVYASDIADMDAHYPVDIELLSLSEEIKSQLDTEVATIRSKVKRAQYLHYFMFAPEHWGIGYTASSTLTAQQTYDQRKGNCISLAALYIASARHVGLEASFQNVHVPPLWENKGDYYVVPGHINAVVHVPRADVHIEFLETFFSNEIEPGDTEVIDDKRAIAEYHNNIAMEVMASGDHYPLVMRHLDKAIKMNPKLDVAWSNYGVVLKFDKQFELAEEKYRRAIALNRRNFSALTNLYVLLSETNRIDEADKIFKKIARYSNKNPHYLAKIAEAALSNEHDEAALKSINKAIKFDATVARFHHIKAIALYRLGEREDSIKALKKAAEAAKEPDDEQRYRNKVSKLLGSI